MRDERKMRDVLAGGSGTESLKGTRFHMRISGWRARVAKNMGRGLLSAALVLLWLTGGHGLAQISLPCPSPPYSISSE